MSRPLFQEHVLCSPLKSRPLLVFFDTEFTGLIVNPRLISIGLVTEAGDQTFYAELSDTWNPSECDCFVEEVVLPLLDGGDCRMTLTELGQRLSTWLDDLGAPLQLATDSLAWDWSWIEDIFHEAGAWPAHVDCKPLLLTSQHIDNHEVFAQAVERAFAAGLRRHHALDDAKANRLGWLETATEIGCMNND